MKALRRTIILAFSLFVTLTTFAQDDQQPAERKAPSAGQVFSGHYARVYGMAMRYNDYSMAKNALYNLYVENPQNDSILYSLSALYLQTGQYASAAISSQDILQMRPKHTGAMEILAVSYENLGVKDKALDTYESLYLESDDFETLYKIAFLQFDLKRYKESTTNADILLGEAQADSLTVVYEDANQKQKEYPIKVAIHNLKGLIAQAQGNISAAKKEFEAALKIAPDFILAKQNMEALEAKK
ncbi:hypothetical protein LVD15_24625 [Fulvivirga maritima]|uniref:tetratricopeptide repeat protein n=1 Tax=Fulvivirga maritima TaxID=2904247 RepID=UPI001F1DF2B3|nr:tetratricopeptide repeat protein [Fulvivirga maritima]UII26443.1 hypothetical protein LVD15_24625 [Fulvivirga maritima]